MDTIDQAPTAKRRRKPPVAAAPSVIEAIPDAPMPVVEAAPEEPPPAAASADLAPTTTAVPEPATPPAAVSADPQTEETTMDTETVTQTAQETRTQAESMFADANTRAQGAMEKSAKMFEEMAALGKGNLEAMAESGRIAARGFESMGQDAAAYAKQSFEQQTAAWKQLASVKSPTEFMKLHGELVRQSFDQMVQQSSRGAETMLKLAGEVAQPLSNRFAVAAEKIKVAA
jgi:phasin family protein